MHTTFTVDSAYHYNPVSYHSDALSEQSICDAGTPSVGIACPSDHATFWDSLAAQLLPQSLHCRRLSPTMPSFLLRILLSLVAVASARTLETSLVTRANTLPAPIAIAPDQNWDGIDGQWSSFTLRVGTPQQFVSFDLLQGTGYANFGQYFHVTLNFANNTSTTLYGGTVSGNGVDDTTYGRVRYDLGGQAGITGLTFVADYNFAGFILDNIVIAAPEPASWGMMIGGFGIVGVAMRRRRAPARSALT